jgi:hypothetical protein
MNSLKIILGAIIAVELLLGYAFSVMTPGIAAWMLPFLCGMGYATAKGVLAVIRDDEAPK